MTVTWTDETTITISGKPTAEVNIKLPDAIAYPAAKTDISKGIVIVNVANQSVKVTVEGETVPASEYHVIYFTYEEIEGGESLTRVGTDFPTAPGTYIAAIVANEDSGFTGENRSEPFTVTGNVAGTSEANPHTGAELPGLAVLALSAAAVITFKKRNK